jgi:amidase
MLAALATGGDLNDAGYIAQRDEAIRLLGTDGIASLLDANNLDALMFPYDWPSLGAVPGYPAIQVPAGFNVNGVPFSVGFVGKPFSEPELIEIAFAFEQATSLRRPPDIATQPADFNFDGAVDAADLAQWQGDFGQNADSDADNDNDSDGADFLAWQRHFNSAPPALTIADPIPEPAALLLALATLILTPRRAAR